MIRPPAAVLPLLAACALAACGDAPSPAAPAAADDPALAALRACVESAPDAVCARPVVTTPSGPVLVDPAYWEARRADAPGTFTDVLVLCGRAGAAGSAVGSMDGIVAARRALARDQLAGRAPRDAALDPGVCRDAYLVYGEARATEGAGRDERLVEAGLTEAEAAFVREQARQARDRENVDRMRDPDRTPTR